MRNVQQGGWRVGLGKLQKGTKENIRDGTWEAGVEARLSPYVDGQKGEKLSHVLRSERWIQKSVHFCVPLATAVEINLI
jgi:hypothetical protein